MEDQAEHVINIKKLSKDEKERIKRALKKKKNRRKRKENSLGIQSNLEKFIEEYDQKYQDEDAAEIELEEEDPYLAAGKDYEVFKNVFAHYKMNKGAESEDDDENEVHFALFCRKMIKKNKRKIKKTRMSIKKEGRCLILYLKRRENK